MIALCLVLAGVAALTHVYIFWLESVVFSTVGRKVFAVPDADLAASRPWALNQGFYNLFLAIGAAIGIGLAAGGQGSARAVGLSLVGFTCGCMLAAALVLVVSDRSKVRGALVQGLAPALALVALVVSLPG